MAKECATPLNYLKGEFQCPFPPKSKRSKRVGSLTDQAQTDAISLKAIRKHYHNPDPIACLVAKVNEAYTGGSHLSRTAVKPDSRFARIFVAKFLCIIKLIIITG